MVTAAVRTVSQETSSGDYARGGRYMAEIKAAGEKVSKNDPARSLRSRRTGNTGEAISAVKKTQCAAIGQCGMAQPCSLAHCGQRGLAWPESDKARAIGSIVIRSEHDDSALMD